MSAPEEKRQGHMLAAYARSVAAEMSKEGWEQRRLLAGMDFFLSGKCNLEEGVVVSAETSYRVHPDEGCPCDDARYRDAQCKHVAALELGWRVKKIMEKAMNDKTSPLFEDDIPEPNMPPPAEPGPHPPAALPEGCTDYPSTLCIKRIVGQTELSWTFRDVDDESALQRAGAMIAKLDAAAKRYHPATPAGAGETGSSAPPPPPPPQQSKAVNHGYRDGAPYCQVHQAYFDLWQKGDRTWWSHKSADGFCNHRD